MKAVKFLMTHTAGTLYAKGETAGFDDKVADDLVKRKIAEEVKVAKKGKGKTDTQTDAAKKKAEAAAAKKKAAAEKAALEKLDVAGLDKIIADEKIEGVAADADEVAKVAAIIEARAE